MEESSKDIILLDQINKRFTRTHGSTTRNGFLQILEELDSALQDRKITASGQFLSLHQTTQQSIKVLLFTIDERSEVGIEDRGNIS